MIQSVLISDASTVQARESAGAKGRGRGIWGFVGGLGGKESACSAGDLGSVPGSGRSSAEGDDYSLLYSYLDNPMARGAWWATVHGVAKSRT